MIQVCFSIHDGTGTYSRFTGTAMLSLFENTQSKVTVHLLHDNTLTDDNRDKLIQIADRYGQQLKFYNVEELCADRLAEINNYFPDDNDSRFSIAMFYRFFIPELLLPQGIEKAIYLDSDIIVNLDIAELWQIELGDKPLGTVPEADNGVNPLRASAMCAEGFVKPENYFNSGVLLMNLKVLLNEEANISAGIKLKLEHPEWKLYDQEILNYCFETRTLKLPLKFNNMVKEMRLQEIFSINKEIYRYADSRASFTLDMRDPYNRLFMDYFIKTSWIDDDTRVALAGGIPSRKYHTVSVVIPMYNAEEFIAECLESLLIQTFQAFEVIVVDDCSTDSSYETVESYAPKFGGRLRLTKTKKNSGGAAFPRNLGLELTRGEYVYFLDADDMLLGTALETLYLAAILYDADVVYTNSYYNFTAPNDAFLHRDSTEVYGNTNLTIDDIAKNLSRLIGINGRNDFDTPWTSFCRRDFLIENKIFFPHVSHTEDFLWVINVYCHARRFLRISTPLNLHKRYNENSITRRIRSPQEQCLYWFSDFENFTKALYELERENEVLAENPFYGLLTLSRHFAWCLNRTEEARKELDSEEIYKILHDEFAKSSSYSSAMLLPFLFSSIDSRKKIIDNEKKLNAYYVEPINKFKPFITARVDIKLMTTEGDFQILSVSDKKARVWKPGWFQKNGIGYQIESYWGQLDFTAKATVTGKISLYLKSLDIRYKAELSKCIIPYWIDYTKLTVNRETIFNTLTPAWHNKPYTYSFEAKADEEIKIHVEWQPHRSDNQ